jgi:putative NADH-flavin reductase
LGAAGGNLVNVLVFGASGATGRHIVAEAARRGHTVVSFVRGGAANADLPPSAGFVYGDATTKGDVDAAIAARPDVVISALGPRSLKKTGLLETTVGHIIGAMHDNRVSRLIELGAAGTFGLPKASRISLAQRAIFEVLRHTVLRHSFDDHAAADRLIHDSELDWTIVQPPELSDDAARGYVADLDGLTRGGALARADVAAAIVDIMERASFVRQSPFLSGAP